MFEKIHLYLGRFPELNGMWLQELIFERRGFVMQIVGEITENTKERGIEERASIVLEKYKRNNGYRERRKASEGMGETYWEADVPSVRRNITVVDVRSRGDRLEHRGAISEVETPLSCYNSICNNPSTQTIWAVAENYIFEPAFVELIQGVPKAINTSATSASVIDPSNINSDFQNFKFKECPEI
ncbi:hypothetical protein L2E82_21992 [Cichorium intybus]|uniref:Uncharacterized protein n=1 Tax=Cichorium intybus TaxID=13427 RepID=A0ACB9DWS5_CICIN|nr:hypothetical protein L2E82_21992 [Cichorium intybus]